jgi:hypothetical protein
MLILKFNLNLEFQRPAIYILQLIMIFSSKHMLFVFLK